MKLSTLMHWIEEGDSKSFDEFVTSYLNGDYNIAFDLLAKQNLLFKDEVTSFFEENLFTNWFTYIYKDDPQYVIDYITENYFGDVIQSNDGYWMNIDREDLSRLFSENRWGDGPRGIAKKVLSDDIDDFFNFVEIDDLYNDVVSELNKDNILRLKESVYNEVEGKEVEIDGETDIITHDQIMEMDEQDLTDFIKENAPEVRSELASLYNSSYESAYYDEVYDLVYRELKYFFGTENLFRDTKTKRTVYDRETQGTKEIEVSQTQVNVTNLLPKVINDVLDWGGYESDNDFDYYGSFEGILNRWTDEDNSIDFNIPDYADWNRVNDNMNDMFRDYI